MAATDAIRCEQLLAMALHDLRKSIQPVQSVLAVVLGERVGTLTPAQQEFLAIAEHASRRMSRLIDDIEVVLEQGRQRALLKEVIDLVPVVERCVSEAGLLAGNFGVVIELDVAAPVLPVRVDPQAIEQILLNLLENAIYYSRQPGTVKLRLKSSNSLVAIRVDNAVSGGMAGDPREWLAPGVRAATDKQPDGRGLGLAVVHRLVELHGGRLISRIAGDRVTMCAALPRGVSAYLRGNPSYMHAARQDRR